MGKEYEAQTSFPSSEKTFYSNLERTLHDEERTKAPLILHNSTWEEARRLNEELSLAEYIQRSVACFLYSGCKFLREKQSVISILNLKENSKQIL